MNWPSRFNMYWVISLLYMGLIFLVSSSPPPVDMPSFSFADKLVHVFEYGLLASLIYFALNRAQANFRPILVAFVIASLYGVSDEIHQYFVAGRNADVFDAVADAVGSLVFPLGIYAIKYGKGTKLPKGSDEQDRSQPRF